MEFGLYLRISFYVSITVTLPVYPYNHNDLTINYEKKMKFGIRQSVKNDRSTTTRKHNCWIAIRYRFMAVNVGQFS